METIGFFGAGKMAEGILSAVLAGGETAIMAEKLPARAEELRQRYGVTVTVSLAEVLKAARLIFLAVRPQDVDTLAPVVAPLLTEETVLVSIVAGRTLARLRELFGPRVRLIRVMPNLALRAHAGMCAICAEAQTPQSAVEHVRKILSGAGEVAVLDEQHFDAVTALSGSGPAYFAYMEEAMAEAGVKLGLPADVARLLAEQTMYGTAKFLRESGMELAPFISGVCTKGGTTAAGMVELSNPQFKEIVAKTLAAAAQRSKELA